MSKSFSAHSSNLDRFTPNQDQNDHSSSSYTYRLRFIVYISPAKMLRFFMIICNLEDPHFAAVP